MPSENGVDEIDERILERLSANAREPASQIAVEVNLSPAAVRRRIARLEATGVIVGYRVLVDAGKFQPAVEAYTEVALAGKARFETAIAEIFKQVAGVEDALVLVGQPDLLLKLRVADINALQVALTSLRDLEEVASSKTMFVLGHQSPRSMRYQANGDQSQGGVDAA